MNNINKLILKLAKKTKYLPYIINDKKISKRIKEGMYKSIYLYWLNFYIKKENSISHLSNVIESYIDIGKYTELMDFKRIYIKVTSRHDMFILGQYLEENGIMWRSGDKFLNLFEKYFKETNFNCILILNDDGKMSYEMIEHIHLYNNDEIAFKYYQDFITFFEEMKEKSNDAIFKSLKKSFNFF